MTISLRKANLQDSAVLYHNRNDALTRKNSHHSDVISITEHQTWLAKCLQEVGRQLFILEVDGRAVGTSRLDVELDGVQISWSIFPEYRGNGYGNLLVKMTLDKTNQPVRAEIKS